MWPVPEVHETFFSVILGLSIAQLLQGISQVVNARDRVRMYWPTMAWTVESNHKKGFIFFIRINAPAFAQHSTLDHQRSFLSSACLLASDAANLRAEQKKRFRRNEQN